MDACSEVEEAHISLRLQRSIDWLTLEIRDSGKVTGLDRIAIMAALNLANELITSEGRGETLESDAAVIRPNHAGDHVEQRCLSGTRRSHKHGERIVKGKIDGKGQKIGWG